VSQGQQPAGACNLCGSRRFTLRFPAREDHSGGASWRAFRCTHEGYGSHGDIVRCDGCGLLFAYPCPPAAEIEARYQAVEDPLYEAEREGRVATFERHLHVLQRHTGPPAGRRLLDVGAYTGVFVEQALRAGWDAVGLEPSAWAVRTARARSLPVVQGLIRNPPFPLRSFDVVTLWDVIEHLTDPRGAMRACGELLRPGGWMVVHTMDAGSPAARLLGKRWPWLMEMHLFYFDRQTLERMLSAAGFEPVDTRPRGRRLRLRYLATRVAAFSPRLGWLFEAMLRLVKLEHVAVPISMGDLITCHARHREIW